MSIYLRWDLVEQLILAITEFRCVTRESIAVLLRSWTYEIPGLPDSSTIEPRILLFHYCDVVLLVKVPLLFVEVDQFLVQQPIEQVETLQTFLDIAAFPEPIQSSADAFQQIIDFVVAKRLPRVVLADSVLYVNHVLADIVHTSVVTSFTKNFSLGLKSLICFLSKSRQVPSVFEKNAHLLLARTVELVFVQFLCPHYFSPTRSTFVLMSGSEKFSLLMM